VKNVITKWHMALVIAILAVGCAGSEFAAQSPTATHNPSTIEQSGATVSAPVYVRGVSQAWPTPGSAISSSTVTAMRKATKVGKPAPGGATGLSPSELKYRLSHEYPDFFFCDPDAFPLGRGDEQELALARFPEAVQDLRVGMSVWTLDVAGRRVAASVVQVARAYAPTTHQMTRLRLDDGREVFASPGHPTADGRTLAQLYRGDALKDARVVSAERVRYAENYTYDILPSGGAGAYWANGILLGSTLRPHAADQRMRPDGDTPGDRKRRGDRARSH